MIPWPEDVKLTLPPRLARWAFHVCGVATILHLDAMLLMAIVDRESLGGDACQPPGCAGTGDGGHGLGLMQIDKRYHPTFAAALGPDGKHLWQHPAFNIMYGGALLRANLDRFQAEEPAVAAYNASPQRVMGALSTLSLGAGNLERVAALDQVTTQKNYVSDVLGRRAQFVRMLTRGGLHV